MKRLFKVLLVFGMWFLIGVNGESFEDLAWKHISGELVEVNTVWVDSQNSRIILIGTNRGVFKSKDGGDSWQAVLFGANKRVNFLYVDRVNKNLIYAGCSNGLFFSRNHGKTWKRIYRGDPEDGSNCLSLLKLKDKELYLGTESGLLRSQDNGRIWHRFSGRIGNLPVRAIAADQANKLIYLAVPEGVYQIKSEGVAKRIFVFQTVDLEETEEDAEPDYRINHICVDPNKPQDIYLATSQGVFESKNQGEGWRKIPDFGLVNRKARFITVSKGSIIWAVTKSGVFVYNKDSWRELSLRLAMQDIRFLTFDSGGNIYVTGDKGLFRSTDYQKVINPVRNQISNGVNSSTGFVQEPTIRQVQQAAIKYAQVIDPEQIAMHRRLSRLKAILPDLSLDYDKTISSYNNSQITRFTIGPRDWGVSIKWSLSDLIWSEQQRLIDSQVRLMVKLRQDVLDEITRLYFERRRLQIELISSPELQHKEKQDQELRIKELTALLDGLTGGYFSKFGLTG